MHNLFRGCAPHLLACCVVFGTVGCGGGQVSAKQAADADALLDRPSGPSVYEAEGLIAEGKFEDALMMLDSLSEQDTNARFHFDRAMALEGMQRFLPAEKAYKKAIAIKGDFVEAINNLANLLRARNELREARALFMKAVELAPSNPEPRTNLGVTLIDMGESDAGMRELERVASDHPKDAWVRLLLAEYAIESGDRVSGLRWAEHAASVVNGDEEVSLELARFFRLQKELARAHRVLIAAGGASSAFWLERALVELGLGEIEDAGASAKRALSLNEEDAFAHYVFAVISRKRNSPDVARSHAENAIRLTKDHGLRQRARRLLETLRKSEDG